MTARQQSAERRSWRDPGWRPEPVVSLNLLGANDFHGQLSPRAEAGRPAGGAAALAANLKAVLNEGKNRVVSPVNLDAPVDYLEALPQPFSGSLEGRIGRVN